MWEAPALGRPEPWTLSRCRPAMPVALMRLLLLLFALTLGIGRHPITGTTESDTAPSQHRLTEHVNHMKEAYPF